MAKHKPAIAYFRVSTAKQGAEGNGIEAQRAAVERLVASHNFDVVAKFTEVESGTRKRRPELVKALAACGEHKATLLIAKIDRLARNVAFIATLMESAWPSSARTCLKSTSSPFTFSPPWRSVKLN